ncbi:sigma-70 family RNA polymerase sigma factor [Sphingobium sp. V4]|uniref:sigma-70 family RNA polymerase sigma factor n=1 Tax=Sphingobium sp. V4 TaxID=3038927 RepID=UPI002557D1AF|nr:sigma-70 family RNA polymerase sigma factor [Sphingobium sp. V4]WIW88081.1 sigma-70 family RNA polymerase sigma factor [Sphingobium sp. V4]
MTGEIAARVTGSIFQASALREVQPLFRMAVLKGATASVLLHIRRGAPVNGRDARGLTPLMLAAAAGREDICTLLIAEGADASSTAPDNRTASDLAHAAGYTRIARLLTLTSGQRAKTEAIAGKNPAEARGSDQEATDWSPDSWEVEEVFQEAVPDLMLRPAVRHTQTALTAARVLNADTDWRDVRVRLPLMDRSVGATDPRLMRAIEKAVARERVTVGVHRWLAKANCAIVPLLEDLGVGIDASRFEADITSWIGDRPPTHSDDEKLADARDALEALHASVSADELFAAELERIPVPDRAAEQSMFRAFESSRRHLFRQICDAVVKVPAILLEVANGDEDGESDSLADGSGVPVPVHNSEALPGTDVDSASEGPARSLTHILLGTPDLASRPGDGIFEDVDVDLELADRLENALRRQGHSLLAGDLASATARYLSDRNRIAEANLALVRRIAPRYAQGNVVAGDLVQEACTGLLRAIERFDASRGNRFATYAVWWIRQSCTRMVDDLERTIRLPVHFMESLRRVEVIRSRLFDQLGRPPSVADIADASGLRMDLLRRLEGLSQQVVNIENPEVWADACLVVDESDDAFDIVLAEQRRIAIAEAVARLDSRDAEVVRRRFGMDTGDDETLEEIGRDMGVTRERIRQLEARALKQLAKPGSLFGHKLRSLL